MVYERNVASLKIEPSVFVFPGDEAVSESDYLVTMRNTYLGKMPFAMALMERFSISLNNEDHERIKRGLVCMGWLDHVLDEAPGREESLKLYYELVNALPDTRKPLQMPVWTRQELANAITLLRNAIAALPSRQRETIAQKAERIGEISAKKATQKDARQYCTTLTEEGALSSDIIIECLSQRALNSAGYARLHAFNERAMAAATLLDAAIDLRQDHKDGLTLVAPTARNKFCIYRKAFLHLPYIIKGLGVRGTMAMVKVGVN